MTTVLAPLVDEVELVDAVEPEVESELSTLVPTTVPTLDTLVPIAVPLAVDDVDEPVVDTELATLVPTTVPTLDTLVPIAVPPDDELVELVLEVELVELVLDVDPSVDCVANPEVPVETDADATPCQTMPTSIIPAATAAMRLTVVRRPGLISTLFPSN
ncbi:hypothetical protein GCM10023201_46970 [Actinomycetospora corticicola]|uniref:Uncharacterized protein n=1 Tax=Actinomycetospora corticicola TaxID=663602 RepID=A0A7Y9J8S8_9PSEU|nr:hypothetical protein [Actinomycetospora corticicola]NYD39593.1 hypothetical protein [Actinomycetospora corticicola]